VLTKAGIHTLDGDITNLKWANLIPQSCTIQNFITFDAKITIAIDTY